MSSDRPSVTGQPPLEPQDVVLRFLESVGRPSEARLYLDLFRERPREQFAAIAIDAHVMADATDAVVLDLKFLAALDLFPTVVLGLFQPADAQAHARRLRRRLDVAGVGVEQLSSSSSDLAARITGCVADDVVPIVVFEPRDGEQPADRLARLGGLLGQLQARKLIFLHRPGGLRVRGVLVPLVNVSADVPSLLASRDLSRKESLIVEQSKRLCEEMEPLPFAVAVTSPLNLLRELFTVKGAGTLLRRGARIARHDGWSGVDVAAVKGLLAGSFGAAPEDAFFERIPSHVYLEENLRGCAILLDSPVGAYLTKFAVSAEAQGEGIARELWDDLVADHPVVFWRARPGNAISEWYVRLCDGLARFPEWIVYWKGLAPDRIPDAIAWALSQPVDILHGRD